MITVHHLNDSRSQRVLWLLEELGAPYTVVKHEREPTQFAPPALKAVHPLGKAPVVEDGGVRLAESGAIVETLIARYGHGRLAPAPGSPDHARYLEWLHYAEGSAMVPLLLDTYMQRVGEASAPIRPRIESELANHLGYIAASLGPRDFLVADALTGADIMIGFVLEVARARGKLAAYPTLSAYLDRLHDRPAWKRAVAAGGTYKLGA